MKRALLLVVFSCFQASAAPKPSQPNPAVPIVDSLQKTWDATKTYEAKFKQKVTAKHLGTEDESEGVVSVSKPNRLRWVSSTDDSVQILNGNKLTNIRVNKRRQTTEVDIYAEAGKAVDSKLLKFLSGKAKFKSLYRFELQGETPEIATIKFLGRQGDGETLIAEIDKKSYLLRSLTSDSSDNLVRIDFSDIRTNVKLDSKLFEYQPKKSDTVRRM
jgi:outer membrane lipoprotein-sorting protein